MNSIPTNEYQYFTFFRQSTLASFTHTRTYTTCAKCLRQIYSEHVVISENRCCDKNDNDIVKNNHKDNDSTDHNYDEESFVIK